MGYGGYGRVLTAEVDKGRRSDALEKRCVDWRRKGPTRPIEEVEELRLNPKSRAGEEKEFVRKLASGRNHGGEDTTEKLAEGVSFRGHCPGAMSSANVRSYSKASYFALVIPPGVGTDVYWGVEQRGTRGGMERSAGMN